ncbi:MAG: phosphoenolpyruvate-protein phosphotransferase [Gammaproteobacteria bacterium]|nr:phosphoenolpyruvate-protein phosphotransferase [Gammaproteobacteria bacterium]
MSKLILVAPLAGWSTPLDEAPDAVFAGRMLGDGVALDPTGTTLYAPCDGELIAVPVSKHSITLRTRDGAEILLHVGIDTVGLGGEGFELHVRQGQQVHAGDRLLSFDLDLLARRAKSLLTPVIVMDGGGFTVTRRNLNREVSVGDFLMELMPVARVAGTAGAAGHSSPVGRAPASGIAPGVLQDAGVGQGRAAGEGAAKAQTVSRRLSVTLEHGIHARPAALLAAALKGFTADVSIVARGREASARSTVTLMTLGVRKGDEIEVRAVGPDADAAVAALEGALLGADRQGGDGARPRSGGQLESRAYPESLAPRELRTRPPQLNTMSDRRAPLPKDVNVLPGVVASRGLAIGHALQFSRPQLTAPEAGAGVSHENSELDRARALVKSRLELVAASGPATAREIIEAHLALLDDPGLVGVARISIASGKSAGYAWSQVIRSNVSALRALQDARMTERVGDLLDLEAQILGALSGDGGAAVPRELPEKTILIANELLPSQLVALDAGRLAGICMAAGGPTSHVAILAAAMGIPALVAIGPAVLAVPGGTPVVLDAEMGLLRIDPDRGEMEAASSELARRLERRAAEQVAAQRECRTADGTRIEVFANVGSLAEAEAAVRNGAEGCGLLRTEFLFLERQSPPDEAEQTAQYQSIATALAGRPLTIRTLDIGGDKPIPYLPLPHEDNPALGLRGVRTSLWSPHLLRTQLRAVLAVRPYDQARVLLPMITDPAEIRTVRRMLDEVCGEAGRTAPIELGVMIETPAAAIMADRIAAEADFLSIGTNDLTQYTLAMDRGHSELAARLDALHPAVLRLISRTVEAAHQHGRRIAVCGGLASDPVAAPVLIGLGVDELSVVPSVIPQLKALIGGISVHGCRELARQALEEETADAVRALAVKMLSSLEEAVPAHE